jgi:hypothetical protein
MWDNWINSHKPSFDDVVKRLAVVRKNQQEMRTVEAHLMGYAHYELQGKDDLEDYDRRLLPPSEEDVFDD